jgi:EAL domain-containing protein (putative c-di-GMP-specific phosphodiesterase class I)
VIWRSETLTLTVLHNFPGDTLKIDRAFVADMITRPESHTIVRSIVGLAHNLGLCLIAEGIEGPEQVAALSALDCELGQGYHFARPQSAAQLEAAGERVAARFTRHVPQSGLSCAVDGA